MNKTYNLEIPLLKQGQINKEITINEAFLIIDAILNNGLLTLQKYKIPPNDLPEGSLILIDESPEETFINFKNHLAFYSNGWHFIKPKEGLMLWVKDIKCLCIFKNEGFFPINIQNEGTTVVTENSIIARIEELEKIIKSGKKGDLMVHNGNNFAPCETLNQFSVNTGKDENNKLSVRGNSTLFASENGDVRLLLNKFSNGNTASFIFQNQFSGMAEFGLIGGNNFILKVSFDGTNWKEVFEIEGKTGMINFKNDVLKNGKMIF